MRRAARPRILPILAALSAASLSACAHAPASTDSSVKENARMSTEDRNTAAPQPKLDAKAALVKVLELIRSSKSINDFTGERVAEVTGLRMHLDGPNRFGANETLTPEWWYSIGMDKATVNGPQFMFDFYPVEPGAFPDATSICSMDFDAFSHELEKLGFNREARYGEHGRIDAYDFDRPGLWVSVVVQGETSEPIEKISHRCVQMIVIR